MVSGVTTSSVRGRSTSAESSEEERSNDVWPSMGAELRFMCSSNELPAVSELIDESRDEPSESMPDIVSLLLHVFEHVVSCR